MNDRVARVVAIVVGLFACGRSQRDGVSPPLAYFNTHHELVVQMTADGVVTDGAARVVAQFAESAGTVTVQGRPIVLAEMVHVRAAREMNLERGGTVHIRVTPEDTVLANDRDAGTVSGFDASERGMARLGALLSTVPSLAPRAPSVPALSLFDHHHGLLAALRPDGTIVDGAGRVVARIDSARNKLSIDGRDIDLDTAVQIRPPDIDVFLDGVTRNATVVKDAEVQVNGAALGTIEGLAAHADAPVRRDGQPAELELLGALLAVVPDVVYAAAPPLPPPAPPPGLK